MKLLYLLLIPMLSGCLGSIRSEAGISNPGISVKRNIFGAEVIIGSQFVGKGFAEWDKSTGSFKVNVEVESDPVPVVEAESLRAQAIFQWYQAKAEWSLESQRIFGQNLAIAAAAGGGDILSKFVGAFGSSPTPMFDMPTLIPLAAPAEQPVDGDSN